MKGMKNEDGRPQVIEPLGERGQSELSAPTGLVRSVSVSPVHEFSKAICDSIELLAGLGVAGDAHCGVTVKHRSRVARNPDQPNFRQVHLIHAELFDELSRHGFAVSAGDLGENILTEGVDLLALPVGTRLHLGSQAVVELTGLRNPCIQIEQFRTGLLDAVLGRRENGELIRKAGVMSVVRVGGRVSVGDRLVVELPPGIARALAPI